MSAVAVIIPVYNKADTVARSIKSVQAQTMRDLEIIVVNDGSTDNSEEVILNTISGDDRCKYVYQENAGVAHARNNGVLNHSTAPFVMCLDSDDAIEPKYIENLLPAIKEDRDIGMVYTALKYITPDGKSGISPWPSPPFDGQKQMEGHNQVPTSALTRRVMWERLGGQRQRYAPLGAGAEDGDFWLRATTYGFRGKYVEHVTNGFFVYSWKSGLVSGNRDYVEVDYRSWSPWARDSELMPGPSFATPRLWSHPVHQYDEPGVSVIIPVGPGHAKYLHNCLDSLDSQTYKKWEAIVVFDVDDEEFRQMANDGTLKYIEKTWPFCRFMSTATGEQLARERVDTMQLAASKASLLASGLLASTPKGAGYARNLGAKRARARLLLFLDADDWLVPEAIKKMIAAFRETKNIIFSDHLAIAPIPKEKLSLVDGKVLDYNDRTGEALIQQRIADYDCERAAGQPYTDGREPYVICNVSSLIPKKWFDEVGGFSTKIKSWEDVLFFWQLSWMGKCFSRVEEPLLVYRYHTGTRRELGLKNAKPLLEYLSDISKRTKKMGCGCRGASPSQVVYTTSGSSVRDDMVKLPLSRGGTLVVSDSDIVLVEFNPPDKGDKMRYGLHQWPGGQIKYGHFAGGETFYVHLKDIEADKVISNAQNRERMFIQIQDAEIIIDDEPHVVEELEPPEEMLEPSWVSDEQPDTVDEPDKIFEPQRHRHDKPPVLADEVLPDPFPEPIESPSPAVDLQLIDLEYDGIKNPDRFIAILKTNGIHTPEELLEYDKENDHLGGISLFKGIGPATREIFVNAAREALSV